MIPLQINNTTGAVVVFGNPACPPPDPPPAGYANYTVDAIPARAAGDTTSVLRWQNGALAWVAPTLTPQQTFNAAVAAGYPVPGMTPPLVLSLAPDAEARFTSLLVLINSLLGASAANANLTQVIFDCEGSGTVLSYAQLQPILIEYGVYSAGLLNTLHAATATAPAPPATTPPAN